MKVAIVINGTRGDVQPMLALATGLQKKGHEIMICAPPENEEFVKRYSCPFIAFGPNYKELFSKDGHKKGGATASPSPKQMKEETNNQIEMLPDIIYGSDLVLGVGFVLGVHTVADILKIPYRFVVFYPSLLGTSNNDPFIYRMLFGFGRSMTNLVIRGFINKKRIAIGLPTINDVWTHWMGDNVIAACDKELSPVNDDVSFEFTQTGYMLLNSNMGIPDKVEQFLSSGEPPVFIGFGSNPIAHPEKYSQIFDEVSQATKQRLMVSKGWANLPANDSSEVLYVDEIPFELLFPRIAAIAFHGGTGTMAIAARAGIPQIAFPYMADQFENRKHIIRLGLGPKGCDFKRLSAGSLSSAISECVSNPTYKKNAEIVSRKLQSTNGLEMSIDLIEKTLG